MMLRVLLFHVNFLFVLFIWMLLVPGVPKVFGRF